MNYYKELTERLRMYSPDVIAYKLDTPFAAAVLEAATVIETLIAELADERNNHDRLQDWDRGMTEKLERVTRERDALLKYVPRECDTCIYWHLAGGVTWCDAPGEKPCKVGGRQLWEWIGVKEAT